MLVYVLCHLGKICGKQSESDWDFSFARRNIRIRIYLQHILLFLNSSINMHLFKTMGRKPSPDQLQIRLSCHVLSILGWKYFCGRNCSTSAIRLLATKYFLFSSWEWGWGGGSSASSILIHKLFGSRQIYKKICGLELMQLYLYIMWLLITAGSRWELMWHYNHSTANKCNITKVSRTRKSRSSHIYQGKMLSNNLYGWGDTGDWTEVFDALTDILKNSFGLLMPLKKMGVTLSPCVTPSTPMGIFYTPPKRHQLPMLGTWIACHTSVHSPGGHPIKIYGAKKSIYI